MNQLVSFENAYPLEDPSKEASRPDGTKDGGVYKSRSLLLGTPMYHMAPGVKKIKSMTVSGRVSLEHFTRIFSSFVMPLSQSGVEIEIRIKWKSTGANPMTESAQEKRS